MTPTMPARRRLRPPDMARVASAGLRTRRLRAALSALGIAIGVAAIVAVLGLSASSQAGLLAEIDRLGTNMLTVSSPACEEADRPSTATMAATPMAMPRADSTARSLRVRSPTVDSRSRSAGDIWRGTSVVSVTVMCDPRAGQVR